MKAAATCNRRQRRAIHLAATATAATLAMTALWSGTARAAVIAINDTTAYTQNFNTLASSGTSSTLPSGWALSESGTGSNSTYAASDGTGGTSGSNTYTIAANTYSFGTAAADRALGTSRDSTTLSSMFGVGFTNNTGRQISGLLISYTGEQWSLGEKNRAAGADRLDFQYSINSAGNLNNGTWTDFNALDYSTTKTNGNAGQMDGNSSNNRTALSATISNTAIGAGQNFWLRWTDLDIAGVDDALSIDDFSITAQFYNNTTIGLSTSNAINFGRVMLNSTQSSSAGLNKSGSDTTTYSITAAGSATSGSAGGNFAANAQVGTFNVGLVTSATGAKTGTVTIKNTATNSENAGQGSSDIDDVINVSGTVLSNRVVTTSALTLGRRMVGVGLTDSFNLSTTVDDNNATRVTVATSTAASDANGISVAGGIGTLFDSASATGTRNLGGSFATTGSKSGTLTLITTGEGLAGEAPVNVSVGYTATSVDNRVVNATSVALGRQMIANAFTGSSNLTTSGADAAFTRVSVATTAAANSDGVSISGGAGTLFNNAAATGSRTIAGAFSSTGIKSGSVVLTTTGEGLAGEVPVDVAIGYTGTAVDNRLVSASTVDFGSIIGGGNVAGISNLSTLPDDDHATRVTVATIAAADSNGISVTGGSGTLFNGASSTGTRSLGGFLSGTGTKSGTLTLATAGEGLAGEAPVNVSIAYVASVLDHSNASFAADGDVDTLLLDFGTVEQNTSQSMPFSIYNLISTAGYTAGLKLESMNLLSDAGVFSPNATEFESLAAGSSHGYSVSFDTTNPGAFNASYTLNLSDEALPGATGGQTLTLNVSGTVVPEPASFALLGVAAAGGLMGRRRRRRLA